MSTAAGAVAGVRLLEKAGDFEPPREEQPGPLHAGADRDAVIAELEALGFLVRIPAGDSSSPTLESRTSGAAASTGRTPT